MASYRLPKKPKKPKSKTNAALEGYLKKVAEWKKKVSAIQKEKDKNKRLREQVSKM